MLDEEKKYYDDQIKLIVGVDEAGRGPLAGPVCAAAVVFPKGYKNELINDSKQLTEKRREELFKIIKKDALGYGIAFVGPEKIDEINIYQATKVAMMDAISQIKCDYQLILTDAMPLKNQKTSVIPIIKGDAKALCIAGASILAKVTRDRYMKELQIKYPGYTFGGHKGYATKKHLEELEKYGPIEGVHRMTFSPIAESKYEQLKLF